MNVDQKPYHHGHLRRTLLDAAFQLAFERGINGFTLREVARQAGVSHAAPYHHFADKSALIEALAVESFEALGRALRTAEEETEGNAFDKLNGMGIGYVNFALRHPAQFRFIFRPEMRQASSPEADLYESSAVSQVGETVYHVLLERIVECQQADLIMLGDPAPLALTAWATVHGLASLLLDGSLIKVTGLIQGKEEVEDSPTRLAKTVTQMLAVGLLKR
ncbi:MAG: TetR/AcrR family transcriptional regulator [Chloroflexota bacterium]|nr:TetR/AcrR family transcriptional regulator [Chloroflexota bacterium]